MASLLSQEYGRNYIFFIILSLLFNFLLKRSYVRFGETAHSFFLQKKDLRSEIIRYKEFLTKFIYKKLFVRGNIKKLA